MIDEQNKMIESEIQKHEELGKMSEQEKETMRRKLEESLDEMKAQMDEKHT